MIGAYTKIYNRFKGYTVEDCDCIFCLHYDDVKKRCPLPKCCCEEERAQAIGREKDRGAMIGS